MSLQCRMNKRDSIPATLTECDKGTVSLSHGELACIVAIQAKMVSGTSRATGDPMGMHTTKVAVGEGKFALEEALEAPSIRAALAIDRKSVV